MLPTKLQPWPRATVATAAVAITTSFYSTSCNALRLLFFGSSASECMLVVAPASHHLPSSTALCLALPTLPRPPSCSIMRAFMIEEQKIVKKVVIEQQKKKSDK